MTTVKFRATIRVDGDEFEAEIIAYDGYRPRDDAPGGEGAAKLREMARMELTVPSSHVHLLGANRDTGHDIVLVDRGTETPCHMLMRVSGNSSANAYLFMEPDHYHAWRAGEGSA